MDVIIFIILWEIIVVFYHTKALVAVKNHYIFKFYEFYS